MIHDWGSRDINFIELNKSIRKSLIQLIDGNNFLLNIPRGWWQDNNVMKKIETTNKERRYVRNKDIP